MPSEYSCANPSFTKDGRPVLNEISADPPPSTAFVLCCWRSCFLNRFIYQKRTEQRWAHRRVREARRCGHADSAQRAGRDRARAPEVGADGVLAVTFARTHSETFVLVLRLLAVTIDPLRA